MKMYLSLLFSMTLSAPGIAGAQAIAPSIVWQQTLGGTGTEVLSALCADSNHNIMLCGYSNSNISGTKSEDSLGRYDAWLVKLDAAGNKVWDKTLGGARDDYATAIAATADGGYLVGITSASDQSATKSQNSFGFSYDYWVVKLDADGNKMWDRTLGGIYNDVLTSVAVLPSGEYVIGGYSFSEESGTKTSKHFGTPSNADYWIVILDENGVTKKQFTLGGDGHDVLTSLAANAPGEFFAGGYSYSAKNNTKTKPNAGNNDYWIMRTNAYGKVLFEWNFGGKLSDYLTCLRPLPDSSFIAGGYSNSPRSGAKSEGFSGTNDLWIIKVKKDGSKDWDKTIKGKQVKGLGGDYLQSVQPTGDGGFILGAYSNAAAGLQKSSNSKGGFDYWLVKLDSVGNVVWDQTIGGSGEDKLAGVYEISPGNYIVAGTSASAASGDKINDPAGAGTTDFWVLRLESSQPVVATQKNKPAIIASGQPLNTAVVLQLSPNPAKDVLMINYTAAVAGSVLLDIYTTSGMAVLQTRLTARGGHNQYNLPIGRLAAGTYHVGLRTEKERLVQSFIKL